MKYTRILVDGNAVEGGRKAAVRRARRAAHVMRALCITRTVDAFVFAGFRYGSLREAVAQATRYLRKDAIGATIMLRPADAQD